MTEIKKGYTRVSTILSSIPSVTGTKENLQEIWGFSFQEIPQDILERKCVIGTNVHEAISATVTNDFFVLTSIERGYFNSYLKWRECINLIPIHSELRLYNDSLLVTGAVDMIATVGDNEAPQLIDFKTSACADPKKWLLQASFYHYLLSADEELAKNLSQEVLFVQLDKNGGFPKVHAFTIDKKAQTLMISAYNIYKFLTDK